MTLEPDWLNIKKWLRTFMDSPNSLGFGKWFPHSDHGHHMGSMWNGSMVWFRYPIHCCHFCLKLRIQWKITDFLWDFVCRVPAVRWGVCRFRPSSCMERRINWFPWHSPRHLWRRCKGLGLSSMVGECSSLSPLSGYSNMEIGNPRRKYSFLMFFLGTSCINKWGIFQLAMFGCRRVQIPEVRRKVLHWIMVRSFRWHISDTWQSCCWAESMKPEWTLNRNGHGSEMVYEWIHILFLPNDFYIVSGVKFYLTGIFTNQLVNAYCIKDYMGIFVILPSQFWCNFTHVFLVFIPSYTHCCGNTLNPSMLCAWHPMTVMSIVFILNLRSAGYHSQCSYHHIMYMISDVEDYKQNI